MRIVIDGRLWIESGVGRYIRNLVYDLQRLDLENEYFLLLLKKNYFSVELKSNFHKVMADFPWYGVTEQFKMLRVLKKLKPDLVHFPFFNVPIFYRGLYVVTIHDLIHQHFQMKRATTHNPLMYKIKKIGYGKVMSSAVKRAQKVLVPSEFVKKQLLAKYKIDRNKVVVTHEGAENSLINLARQNRKTDFNKVSRKFAVKKPYFFYVGNAHPHKNLRFLIKSFLKFLQIYPNYHLVLSGPEHVFWQQLKKEFTQPHLQYTGFVSERELVTLYSNAEALICPSLEEGFGIPILEAMACHCPVISSKAASLPEVGGDAALYFDPQDENNLIKLMREIKEAKNLKSSLIKKGEKRYKGFGWKKLASQTFEVYNEMLQKKSS